jgi:hypothetical protein
MSEICMSTVSIERIGNQMAINDRRVLLLREGIRKAIERLTLPGSSAAERSTAASLKKVLARDEKEAQR